MKKDVKKKIRGKEKLKSIYLQDVFHLSSSRRYYNNFIVLLGIHHLTRRGKKIIQKIKEVDSEEDSERSNSNLKVAPVRKKK